ncbi:MAG: ion transporter [Lachnospiraceae bacterium]|nr:ion transporter [Lachnospiraceae bacterium]
MDQNQEIQDLNTRRIKKRVFEIISIGYTGDFASKLFDIWTTAAILANLVIVIAETFTLPAPVLTVLMVIETITVISFTIEYILRVWTAEYLYPGLSRAKARVRYIFSFMGLVDLVSFLPFYLPAVFPAGIVAFRMLRVVRILRLFRITGYYDSLNVIGDVLRRKKNQLISSIFIILVLMLASSLCMYSLEHAAQPEVFDNAFSGLWWAVSTLLTVGYGDIYPITLAGRIFGIITTFLGVGMVAIPTGILSAGFVEQYQILKESQEYALNEELRFVRLDIESDHLWKGKSVRDLTLPPGMILAVIRRGEETILPNPTVQIREGDSLVLGAEATAKDAEIEMKELKLRGMHPWVGQKLKDLDISRQTLITLIHRGDTSFIPNGETQLQAGDTLFLYTKHKVMDAETLII